MQQNPKLDAATFITIFVILGYDRFSVAFTSIILELANDKELQEELCSEIREKKRYFMTCEKLEKFLSEKLSRIPATPIVVKESNTGVAVNGSFIPPNTGMLLSLQNEDTFSKIMGKISESMTMNLMKLFVGEFIVRCKFEAENGKKEQNVVGCGISLRRKSARILVRNRY